MLDTPRVVTTPEGIELTLRVAGPITRARAWAIDFLVRGVIYLIAATALSSFGNFGSGIFLLIFFLLEWAYPILFEVYWHGATPGKRACHLRVLHDDGTPVAWRASVIRNTMRAVDFLPLMYGFGLVSAILNRDFKRLGDLAAGTIVIYVQPSAVRVRSSVAAPAVTRITHDIRNGAALDNTSSSAATAPVAEVSVIAATTTTRAPTMQPVTLLAELAPLRLDEQRAVIDFAERRKRWSDARAAELAQHATGVLNGVTGMQAVERLLTLARAFTGKTVAASSAADAKSH